MSARKKPLSLEEKRQKMIEVFHETEDVFILKELEKKCVKDKGIVLQSVKDVLEGLIADNFASGEKVGTMNIYWSFPSQALLVRNQKQEQLEGQLAQLRKDKELALAARASAEAGREDTPERRDLLHRLAVLNERKRTVLNDLSAFAECDPELLSCLQADIATGTAAANRWTDNLFILRDMCRDKFGLEPDRFNQGFGVAPDLDYL